jgi:nitrate/TMAO reductase-like tetraheme cytochrome c subunit
MNHPLRWQRNVLAASFALACLAWGTPPAQGEEAAQDEESCVRCHRDPDFLVTHPKLYQYFRDWEGSIHRQEGVSCSDCHGGRPEATTRAAAHAGMLRESSPESTVNYANVPSTCGSCHGDVEEAYRKSAHAQHLTRQKSGDDEAEQEKQGPSCVTCHASMNTLTLDVTTVESTCERCHDTDNHPEIPAEARAALNRFLSIDRFHRYIAVRAKQPEGRAFLERIDKRREALSVLWHTFDLESIDAATAEILEDLRKKRDEIRAEAHAQRPETGQADDARPAPSP